MNIWKLCKGKTLEELEEYETTLLQRENLTAAHAVHTWIKFFGKKVEVVKGKKVPLGTKGEVFFIKSAHYGSNKMLGWSYLIGIVKEDGTKVFTNSNNVEVVA